MGRGGNNRIIGPFSIQRRRGVCGLARVDQTFRDGLIELLPRLRRFARALAGRPDQADDLVQAALEKALTKSQQWRGGTRLDSWMFRIVQTTWIDTCRAASIRGSHLEAVDPETVADYGPLRRIEARLTLAAVRQAIRALPDPQRAVLGLVCVEGLSYREAADVLGIPVGTVMSRLSRARLSLDRMVRAAPVAERPQETNEVGHGTV